jgi:hypothetical protein
MQHSRLVCSFPCAAYPEGSRTPSSLNEDEDWESLIANSKLKGADSMMSSRVVLSIILWGAIPYELYVPHQPISIIHVRNFVSLE